MDAPNREYFQDAVILGGGPAGLSAGSLLAESGADVLVVERQRRVGGLAKTVHRRGFRFDIGGHRFLTDNPRLEALVRERLNGDLLVVERSSKILLDDIFYDYPLSVGNAVLGLGLGKTARAVADYLWERVRARYAETPPVSLEDWVVRHFGRSLFELFFKEYSEKLWGIPCDRISAEWITRRVQGLSLGTAVNQALARTGSTRPRTLAERFLYPSLGIGQICDSLRLHIDRSGRVATATSVVGVKHRRGRIRAVEAVGAGGISEFVGREYISSIPLPVLVRLLKPQPPTEVLSAAAGLQFRDLVVVAVMLDRDRATDQTWLYIPDRAAAFGRIHEPKNWSIRMAPAGKTHLVAEFFCFQGDELWSATDAELTRRTVQDLTRMRIIDPSEVLDSSVLRVRQAYPLFEVDYLQKQQCILEYLDRFSNLELIGRGGRFEYFNTDHAMESGIHAAEAVEGRIEHLPTF